MIVRRRLETSANVMITLDDVDMSGPMDIPQQNQLTQEACALTGDSLDRFYDWTVTRYSLDRAAVVTLHKS